MKLLVISNCVSGTLAIVHRLAKEGHDVKWFSFDDTVAGRGIVDKPDGWRSEIGAADVVVCVGKGLANVVAVAQGLGKPILGASNDVDMSHKDIVGDIDLPLLDAITVPREDTSEVLQGWQDDGLFVSQQDNDWPEFVWECTTPEDYAYVVQNQIDGGKHIIQRRKGGVPVSIVGWWNGRKWLKPFHLHWKFSLRESFSGGMLTALQNQDTLDKTIMPLKDMLKLSAYKGPVSVDCILGADGAIHVMNVVLTLRPDYFALLAEIAFQGMAELLFETATGTATGIRCHNGYVVGDVLRSDATVNAPINGLNEHNMKHIAFAEVRGDDRYFYVSKPHAPVMMITARGESLREAGRRVIRSNSNISILRVQKDDRYRVDVFAEKQLGKLLNWRHV